MICESEEDDAFVCIDANLIFVRNGQQAIHVASFDDRPNLGQARIYSTQLQRFKSEVQQIIRKELVRRTSEENNDNEPERDEDELERDEQEHHEERTSQGEQMLDAAPQQKCVAAKAKKKRNRSSRKKTAPKEETKEANGKDPHANLMDTVALTVALMKMKLLQKSSTMACAKNIIEGENSERARICGRQQCHGIERVRESKSEELKLMNRIAPRKRRTTRYQSRGTGRYEWRHEK